MRMLAAGLVCLTSSCSILLTEGQSETDASVNDLEPLTPSWATTIGGPGVTEIRDIAVSGDRIYVVGNVAGDVNFDGAPEDVGPMPQAFIATYTHGGAYLDHLVLSAEIGRTMAVAADAQNVYVGGVFRGTVMLGNSPITADTHDAFIASFDKDLSYRWHNVITGTGFQRVNAMDVRSNQLLIAGEYQETPTFGADTELASADQVDGFSASLNVIDGSELGPTAFRYISGPGNELALDVRIAPSQAQTRYVAGTLSDPDHAFLSSSGETSWNVPLSGNGTVEANAVAVLTNRTVCTGGRYDQTLEWLEEQEAVGAADAFVGCVSELTGDVAWQRSIVGRGTSDIRHLTGIDQLLSVGQFTLDIAIDDHTATSRGALDIFLLEQTLDGEPIRLTTLGGTGNDTAGNVEILTDGSYIVAGNFVGQLLLADAVVATADPEADGFIVRLIKPEALAP